MTVDLTIFKDYDIRGTYPDQLNGQVAILLAHALVRQFSPRSVCLCRDMRLSGQELFEALVAAFTSLGVTVYDAGLTGTEMQYFIAGTKPYDLVLMISASHNPAQYNGIKVVKRGPIAVTKDSGLAQVRDLIGLDLLPSAKTHAEVFSLDLTLQWKQKILSLVDTGSFKSLNVVADAGNGMAGKLVTYAFGGLPFKLTPLYFEPDGHFPNHVPNPLIEKNNADLIQKILALKADVGLTFDGDADRMFLVDDKGRLVSGTLTTALLARYILSKHPAELILYNAICGRIVPKVIAQSGGKSKRVRVGHSYIKTYMRETGAIFAGEHSGHYYFRDFFCAESGVLTALMVLSLLCHTDRKLSQLVDEVNIYPASGEINFNVSDIPKVVAALKTAYADAQSMDELDGVSIWYPQFWFNVRSSKTEPLLRLNLEADNQAILQAKTQEIVRKIESLGGKRKE